MNLDSLASGGHSGKDLLLLGIVGIRRSGEQSMVLFLLNVIPQCLVVLRHLAVDSRQQWWNLVGFHLHSDINVMAHPTSGPQLTQANIISPGGDLWDQPCSSCGATCSAVPSFGLSACFPNWRGEAASGLSLVEDVSYPWEVVILSVQLEHDSFVCVFAWVMSTPLKSFTDPRHGNGSLSSFGSLGLDPMTMCVLMAVNLLSHASEKLLTCLGMCVVSPLCFAWQTVLS